jgi:transaldolase
VTNSTALTNLHRLYQHCGQSPWLDNLTRDLVTGDGLARLVEDGIRGVTANPTIVGNAIANSAAYDEQLRTLVRSNHTVEEAYWSLVIDDVTGAADVLRRIHNESDGNDGFVSLEVDPALAYDGPASVQAAARLRARIDRPNVLIKIPATASGIDAIRAATAAGISINVTLIFSLERYAEVIDAYLSGLETLTAAGGDPADVHGVASFFVSRVDAEVARRLTDHGGTIPGSLRGRVAIAQAKLAYRQFTRTFTSDRWAPLAAAGARPQKPLWASTSTKDPSLPDTLFVDELIGPHTITTLPERTIEAFNDHGTVRRTIDLDLDRAEATLDEAAAAGIQLRDVGMTLEDRGVASFGLALARVLQTMHQRLHAGITGGGAHAA